MPEPLRNKFGACLDLPAEVRPRDEGQEFKDGHFRERKSKEERRFEKIRVLGEKLILRGLPSRGAVTLVPLSHLPKPFPNKTGLDWERRTDR